MRLGSGRFVAVIAIAAALAGCGKKEEYANVTDDQMNHYAGLEAHDHPVENSSDSALPRANMQAPESRTEKPAR